MKAERRDKVEQKKTSAAQSIISTDAPKETEQRIVDKQVYREQENKVINH